MALLNNVDAAGNTAIGAFALQNNDMTGNGFGVFNTAVGSSALAANADGFGNTAVGAGALNSNQESSLTAVGFSALTNNTNGNANTAVGAEALEFNDTAERNTAIGFHALLNNNGAPPLGSRNTAVGADALFGNTDGQSNNGVGDFALARNTAGDFNEAIGVSAMFNNDTGDGNVAIGDNSLEDNVSGNFNTAVGFVAGQHITASGNICIGAGVTGIAGETGVIRIADNLPPIGGTTSRVFVGGISGFSVGAVNAPVLVNANGQLGTIGSSARFKKDIKPMDRASEAILGLRPVTFHYKGDGANTPCFGLIAEDVAKVDPALILMDKEGKPYTVRYEQINAMLLNEFLKEHRKVQELEAAVSEQQQEIKALAEGLEKVSAQLEINQTQRVVTNTY